MSAREQHIWPYEDLFFIFRPARSCSHTKTKENEKTNRIKKKAKMQKK